MSGNLDQSHPQAKSLAMDLANRVDAKAATVYLLDLSRAGLVPIATWPPGDSPPPAIPIEAVPGGPSGELAGLLGASAGKRGARPGAALYARRGPDCVGAIALEGVPHSQLDSGLREELELRTQLLVPVYENAFLHRLLGGDLARVDLGLTEEELVLQGAQRMEEATGLTMGVVSRVEGRRLRAIHSWGIARPPAKLNADDLGMGGSVALPVRVEEEVAYMLTLGVAHDFSFTAPEIRGLQSLARQLDHSLTAFHDAKAMAAKVFETTAPAVSAVSVGIAQAARHEALNQLDVCNTYIHRLWRKFGEEAKPELDALSSHLRRVRDALNWLRQSLYADNDDWTTLTIQDLWDEVTHALEGSLRRERIDTHIRGPETEVEALPSLRLVFMHLILNSIDSFRRGRKSGREIELSVEPASPQARDVRMRYRDNGPGLNRSRLETANGQAEVPISQLMFEPGVSSKSDGTGLGLWLTRRVLENHSGSIDLVSYRQGVTFAIKLPNPHNSSAPRRR